MRVLWVDAEESPWTDRNGWGVLEDFGLRVQRVSSTKEASLHLSRKEFDLLLVRAEVSGAESFLVKARAALAGGGRKLVLASSTWSKEQFKAHSKTSGAAHRYARVPMPPEGFLGLVADLFDCTVEELAAFTVPPDRPTAVAAAEPVSDGGSAARGKRKPSPALEAGDVDVLRKYLRIKEEQLEISEGERRELVLENERHQREAHQLQVRLREFEHLFDETNKKIAHMEEERLSAGKEVLAAEEQRSRLEKTSGERIRALEARLQEADEKYESLRQRVRKDIRKIRENERDLEARLELLRRDSETLLHARDEKVLEMQRKIDALEFDLDQVQDGRVQAQMEAERYLTKLSRVARALHLAIGMIEEDHSSDEELEEMETALGGAANAEEPDSSGSSGASGNGPSGGGGAGSGVGEPSGAALPPADEFSAHAADLDALAQEGEPTQMISAEALHDMGGEPESSSG